MKSARRRADLIWLNSAVLSQRPRKRDLARRTPCNIALLVVRFALLCEPRRGSWEETSGAGRGASVGWSEPLQPATRGVAALLVPALLMSEAVGFDTSRFDSLGATR